MASVPHATDLQDLRRLGDGSADARLRMRLVFRILLRCLGLLRPVRKHVLWLLSGFATMTLLIAPLMLIFIDTLWREPEPGSGQGIPEIPANLTIGDIQFMQKFQEVQGI